MGQAILYCFRCSTQLREAQFESGKAYRIDAWVCCAACAPEALRSLPPDRVQVLLKLIAGKEKPSSSSTSTHALRESRINFTPPPTPIVKSAPSKPGQTMLIIGAVVAVLLVLVIIAVVSGRSTPASTDAPESADLPPPNRPSPPPGPGVAPEDPARVALKKAQAYARSHPDDIEGQLREFGDLVLLSDKKDAGAEARRMMDSLQARERESIEKALADLNREISGPLERQDFASALRTVETARNRKTGAQWGITVAKREEEIRAQRFQAFEVLKGKAKDAKAKGNAAQVDAYLAQARGWSDAMAAELEKSLASGTDPAPPPPPPPPDPGPARSAEAKAYLAKWEAALPRATGRDYAAAAAELEKAGDALKEDGVKQELAQDLRDLKELDRSYVAAVAALASSRTLALSTLDGRSVSGRVLSIDADRVELMVEPGKPTAFVEWSDVAASTLAGWLKAQNVDARLLGLFLLLEGDASGLREGIASKYGAYAIEKAAKAPKPGADELAAREAYYEAERQFRSMATREKAVEAYKQLKLKFKDTRLVRRAAARIERRAEAGKDYYLLGSDLASSGTFALTKEGRLESMADSEAAQANRNWVEAEYVALPSLTYRCWALVGGCCGEAFTFHYQATGLTEVSPKTRKRAPAEPGGDLASPVKHAIKGLKPTHPNAAPKKATRWEWIEVVVPRSATPGPKKIRFLTDQQGFGVASFVVSSTRSRAPTEAEVAEMTKLRALDAVPAWAVERPGSPARILLDDFETAAVTWRYIGGDEFPGAKGSMSLDPSSAHDGKGSMKIQGDFSGGGSYVGAWRELPPGRELKEIRLWLKTNNAVRFMIRYVDATDQCHQRNLPLASSKDWQEVVLKGPTLAGDQHWGGANDGKWHGFVKSFGVHVTADSFAGGKTGEVWVDDVEGVLNTETPDSDR